MIVFFRKRTCFNKKSIHLRRMWLNKSKELARNSYSYKIFKSSLLLLCASLFRVFLQREVVENVGQIIFDQRCLQKKLKLVSVKVNWVWWPSFERSHALHCHHHQIIAKTRSTTKHTIIKFLATIHFSVFSLLLSHDDDALQIS